MNRRGKGKGKERGKGGGKGGGKGKGKGANEEKLDNTQIAERIPKTRKDLEPQKLPSFYIPRARRRFARRLLYGSTGW